MIFLVLNYSSELYVKNHFRVYEILLLCQWVWYNPENNKSKLKLSLFKGLTKIKIRNLKTENKSLTTEKQKKGAIDKAFKEYTTENIKN